MSSNKDTSFAVLITFDSNVKHSEITSFLGEKGINKSSLSNYDVPNNIYTGVVRKSVTTNSSGDFTSAILKDMSDNIAKKFREMLKKFFDENDLDGKIYVLVSWNPATDDTVTR
ncbi:hypothetical protein [Serratia quinivorans]